MEFTRSHLALGCLHFLIGVYGNNKPFIPLLDELSSKKQNLPQELTVPACTQPHLFTAFPSILFPTKNQ